MIINEHLLPAVAPTTLLKKKLRIPGLQRPSYTESLSGLTSSTPRVRTHTLDPPPKSSTPSLCGIHLAGRMRNSFRSLMVTKKKTYILEDHQLACGLSVIFTCRAYFIIKSPTSPFRGLIIIWVWCLLLSYLSSCSRLRPALPRSFLLPAPWDPRALF